MGAFHHGELGLRTAQFGAHFSFWWPHITTAAIQALERAHIPRTGPTHLTHSIGLEWESTERVHTPRTGPTHLTHNIVLEWESTERAHTSKTGPTHFTHKVVLEWESTERA